MAAPKTFGRFCTVQKERIKNKLAGKHFTPRVLPIGDKDSDLYRMLALEDCDELQRNDYTTIYEYRRGLVIAGDGA